MTFLKAVRDYFGTLPEYHGEVGLKGFVHEMRELPVKDREELAIMLSEHFEEPIEMGG